MAYVNKPIDFWKRVIWTVESKYELTGSKRRQIVWRKAGTEFNPAHVTATVKHGGGSVLVWGAFSWFGLSNLEIINGIMNSDSYIDILERNISDCTEKMGLGTDLFWQQDNDPKHKSKKTMQYIQNRGINMLDWPAQSPDSNPIEHLWDHLDRIIPKN